MCVCVRERERERAFKGVIPSHCSIIISSVGLVSNFPQSMQATTMLQESEVDSSFDVLKQGNCLYLEEHSEQALQEKKWATVTIPLTESLLRVSVHTSPSTMPVNGTET